ncbi:MAG: MerR family transcriptional regulator [candidate division Zixibacteria bacterium]|nr:MerR family transcriptional regulator [candidate division Zixibacteria bacterium]
MQKQDSAEKLYYTISEVSKMTGLEAYVLRYWEKEFPQLKPRKNRGGSRLYTPKDIEVINQINYLRTKEKLTIAGARNKLLLKRGTEERSDIEHKARTRSLIGKIRKELEELLKYFP